MIRQSWSFGASNTDLVELDHPSLTLEGPSLTLDDPSNRRPSQQCDAVHTVPLHATPSRWFHSMRMRNTHYVIYFAYYSCLVKIALKLFRNIWRRPSAPQLDTQQFNPLPIALNILVLTEMLLTSVMGISMVLSPNAKLKYSLKCYGDIDGTESQCKTQVLPLTLL